MKFKPLGVMLPNRKSEKREVGGGGGGEGFEGPPKPIGKTNISPQRGGGGVIRPDPTRAPPPSPTPTALGILDERIAHSFHTIPATGRATIVKIDLCTVLHYRHIYNIYICTLGILHRDGIPDGSWSASV